MISRRVSLTKARLDKNFTTTVGIFAGYPSMDLHGARIMKSLNERADEKINYFGIGGPQMQL